MFSVMNLTAMLFAILLCVWLVLTTFVVQHSFCCGVFGACFLNVSFDVSYPRACAMAIIFLVVLVSSVSVRDNIQRYLFDFDPTSAHGYCSVGSVGFPSASMLYCA